LKSEYFLLHPEKLLFVDEVGNNTSQANDGNVGGEKFLCFAGGRPQQRANMKDAHFTVLGFTAATGEPVMCCIIFACKELEPMMVQGLDPFATWEGDELDIEKKSGPGKRHPHGPQCIYNGITVPCFCACSESGSITGELLAEMIKFMDKKTYLIVLMGSHLFYYWMAMGADSNSLFWSIYLMMLTNGRFASASPTALPIGKWGIAPSKMGASKWPLLKQNGSWSTKKKMQGYLEQLKKQTLFVWLAMLGMHHFPGLIITRKQ